MGDFGIILLSLKYLWDDEWKLRFLVIAAFILTIIAITSSICVPIALKYSIDILASSAHSKNYSMILSAALLYGGVWVLSQTANVAKCLVFHKPVQRAIKKLVMNTFNHVNSLSMRFHLDKKSGAIVSIFEQIYTAFTELIHDLIWQTIPLILQILIATLIILKVCGLRYSLILAITIIAYLSISLVTNKRSNLARTANIKMNQLVSSHFLDILLNYESTKIFDSHHYENKISNDILKNREDSVYKLSVRMDIICLLQMLIVGVGLTLTMYLAAHDIAISKLTVGDFALLNGYILEFSIPLSYFSYIINNIKDSAGKLRSAFDLLQLEPDVKESYQAKPLSLNSTTIIFNNVCFSYRENSDVLKNLCFTVPCGSKIAIVGTTGSGKSTIFKLLLRFFDVTSGSITIGNQNIKDVNLLSLRNAIGVVPQDTILFNRSIYENIIYGNPIATIENVEQVIKQTRLESLIKSLPDGYHTRIGERGIKISGGEKQRIGIARMLLKQPSIYIFDEATSSLDINTAREIQNNIDDIIIGKTSIIITHHLSNITNVDKIYVLDKGVFVEVGSHQTLLAKKGFYCDIWHKQIAEIVC